MSPLFFLLLMISSRSDAAISSDGKHATYIHVVWSKADQAAHKFTSGCMCLKPQEDETARNCRPLDSSQFPSPKAVCDCVKCKRNATLSCSCDGRWYADIPSQCDAENNCGMCPSIVNNKDVRCLESQAGRINEKRTCRCRGTCTDVGLTCDESWDGLLYWSFDDNDAPCDDLTYKSVPYVTDVRSPDGLQVVLFNGIYSFSCTGNGQLDQQEVQQVTCRDGEINGQFPTCIPSETAESTVTTESIQETGQQTSTTTVEFSTSATLVDMLSNNQSVFILMYAAITIMALVLLICCTTIAIIVIKRRKQAKYSTQKGIN